MSNLGALLKLNFQKFAGALRKKSNKKSAQVGIGTVIILGLGILALYSLQAWSMFKGLAPEGLSQLCIFHACLVTVNVLVILSVMRSVGKKKQTDEIMLSFPIKKIDIVLSKLIGTYLIDLFFTFTLIMPFIIIYMIFESFSISMLLFGLLLTIILPLFSVGLSLITKFLIRQVFNKSKFANFYKSLVSVVILVASFAFIFFKTFGYGKVNSGASNSYFSDRKVTELLAKIVLNQDIISFLIILSCCLWVFVVGTILESVSLNKDVARYVPKKHEISFSNQGSLTSCLIKKEVNNYLTTPAYVSNTILGPIMAIMLSIIFSSMGLKGVEQKLGLVVDKPTMCGLLTMLIMFSLSTAIISCSSVSLEGKKFWVLKSSPISEKKLLFAKAVNQLIFTLPAVLISSVICLVSFKFSLVEFLILTLVPSIFMALLAFLGVYVNILFPKLDWTEETQAIKQSMSALIMMLGGMIFSIIPLGIYLWIYSNVLVVGLISFAIYLVLLIVSICVLFTNGVKKFRNIH